MYIFIYITYMTGVLLVLIKRKKKTADINQIDRPQSLSSGHRSPYIFSSILIFESRGHTILSFSGRQGRVATAPFGPGEGVLAEAEGLGSLAADKVLGSGEGDLPPTEEDALEAERDLDVLLGSGEGVLAPTEEALEPGGGLQVVH